MRHIKSMAEVEEILARYVPLQRRTVGKQITLERMQPLMAALGNPQDRLKIIHVAGTSGKTSTCYYIAALLGATGKKVGLTVSPHIDSVAERLQINLEPLPESAFAAALSEYLDIIEAADLQPTYFELLVGLAYWYFEREGVDYAVVETGLGGLHDGTNIAGSLDKVCVITDIGLDHTHILGDTLPEIAAQKAGIIHQGNTVFMLAQPDEVLRAVAGRCDDQGALLKIVPELSAAELPDMLPEFQRRNASLAYQVCRAVLHDTAALDVRQAASITVPGRMDKAAVAGKTIIMDGAHNEQKMRAFVHSFERQYPGKKVPALFALKGGKEAVTVLPLLRHITSVLIVTEYYHTQGMPVSALDSHELGALARKFGMDVRVQEDAGKAFADFLELVDDIGVVTGSFYLIGQLRDMYSELC